MRCQAEVMDKTTGKIRKCKKDGVADGYCIQHYNIHYENTCLSNSQSAQNFESKPVCCVCRKECNSLSQLCSTCSIKQVINNTK